MARLSISLLGSFQVFLEDKEITAFESNKARALLAYLVLESDRAHRRETLAGMLWPERPERDARHSLSQALSNLRTLLSETPECPPLTATRQAVQFNAWSQCWLDVTAFTARLDACAQHPHRRLDLCEPCIDRLHQSTDLYRGSFLEGFSLGDSAPFEEWMLLQQERFHSLAVDALRRLARCHELRGESTYALQYARRYLQLEPWREGAHRQVMRTLAATGQRNAALAQYEACRRTLAAELGVEPEAETAALYRSIRAGVEFASPPGLPPHNLPAHLTPFVGREAELAEISARLGDPACRLLTLVGPGGSGKTRLALEAATDALYADHGLGFTHGVYIVSLAPLQSVKAIVPTVAQALGFAFRAGGDPRQQLLDYMRRKNMLLILDNAEHLLGPNLPTEHSMNPSQSARWDVARIAADILQTAASVKVLVTSRTRLNVRGEHLLPVPGLDVPAFTSADRRQPPAAPVEGRGKLADVAQYSAVRLFLDSARRVRPGFQPTESDLAHIGRICHLLHGLPLAILLAAAWTRMLSPADIALEIATQAPGHGVDFLESTWAAVPQRQRSMRAVFDHSWNLLTGRERQVFQAFSVFRGGCTREAAQQVAGASLRELMALLDRSLLQRTSAGRFEMHELLRQYAAERLDRSPDAGEAVRDRHCAYYAAALERWAADLQGLGQQAALDEMETEIDNARAAWDRAARQGLVARLDGAIDGLCHFYERRGRWQEGEAACRRAVAGLSAKERPGAVSRDARRVLIKALAWQGAFNRTLGHVELAGQLLERSLAVLDDLEAGVQPTMDAWDARRERAFALLRMGELASDADRREATRLYTQSLALFEEVGDRWGAANALYALGEAAENVDAYDEARGYLEGSLALRRALGDRRGIARSLLMLSAVTRSQGHIEEAEQLAREGSAILQKTGNRADMAEGLSRLGWQLIYLGKYAEACSLLEESLEIYSDLGSPLSIAFSSLRLTRALFFHGRYEQMRALAEKTLPLSQGIDSQYGVAVCLSMLGCAAWSERRYTEAQRLLQAGITLFQEFGQWDDPAACIACLALIARERGQLSQAKRYLWEALQMALEVKSFVPLLMALPGVALFFADGGEKKRAVEIYALASCHSFVRNSRWFEDVAGRHIAAIAATLPPNVVAAAQERGCARDLWPTAEELLAELEGADPSD